MTTTPYKGHCLCGAVQFTVNVPEPKYSICHCGMCRRWSAGPFMSVHGDGPLEVNDGADALTWYRGSKWAERGFCGKCGSTLFYRLADQPDMFTAVSVEALNDGADLELKRHIYVDSQPAHYAFADDTPRVTEAELMAELGIKPSA